jgi:hypothetical protein
MSEILTALLLSAERIRRAWPKVAAALGCHPDFTEIETLGNKLSVEMDRDCATDYFVTRTLSGAKVPVATRTHVPTGGTRRYTGWTVRHGPGVREYQRLCAALQEPMAVYARLMIEGYFDEHSGSMRICVARTADVISRCRKWETEMSTVALIRAHLLRENDDDRTTFFAPSFANLVADGAPCWQGDITPAAQDTLFGDLPEKLLVRAENGAPERLWSVE